MDERTQRCRRHGARGPGGRTRVLGHPRVRRGQLPGAGGRRGPRPRPGSGGVPRARRRDRAESAVGCAHQPPAPRPLHRPHPARATTCAGRSSSRRAGCACSPRAVSTHASTACTTAGVRGGRVRPRGPRGRADRASGRSSSARCACVTPARAVPGGWRSRRGGPGLIYSGDASDPDELARAAATRRPRCSAEATFGVGPVPAGMNHLDGPMVGALAARAGAGRVVVTHVRMGCDLDATVAAVRAGFRRAGGHGTAGRPVPGRPIDPGRLRRDPGGASAVHRPGRPARSPPGGGPRPGPALSSGATTSRVRPSRGPTTWPRPSGSAGPSCARR